MVARLGESIYRHLPGQPGAVTSQPSILVVAHVRPTGDAHSLRFTPAPSRLWQSTILNSLCIFS